MKPLMPSCAFCASLWLSVFIYLSKLVDPLPGWK